MQLDRLVGRRRGDPIAHVPQERRIGRLAGLREPTGSQPQGLAVGATDPWRGVADDGRTRRPRGKDTSPGQVPRDDGPLEPAEALPRDLAVPADFENGSPLGTERNLHVPRASTALQELRESLAGQLDGGLEHRASLHDDRLVGTGPVHAHVDAPPLAPDVHARAGAVCERRGRRMGGDGDVAPRGRQGTAEVVEVEARLGGGRQVHPVATAAPSEPRARRFDTVGAALEQLEQATPRRPPRRIPPRRVRRLPRPCSRRRRRGARLRCRRGPPRRRRGRPR